MNDAGDNQKQQRDVDGKRRSDVLGPHYRRRQSRWEMGLAVGLGVLVILAILVTVTPLHDLFVQRISPRATPTLPLSPGDDLFYIQAQPWGTVTLDGHTLTQLPSDQSQPPLRLAQGTHQIHWRADPFQMETCTLSVPPPLNGAGCPYESSITLQSGTPARLITFSASLALLPADQRNALLQKAQAALNTLRASTTVQPGEVYANAASSHPFDTATQPLQATLQFALDTDLNSSRTCATQDFNGCKNGQQDCRQFCTLGPAISQTSSTSANIWDAIAVMYPTWNYATASGHTLIQNQPAIQAINGSDTDHSFFLHMIWDNGVWNVTVPPIQSTQLGSLPPDPGCAALQNTLSQNSQYQSTEQTPKQPVTWELTTGTNRATGCLGIAVLQSNAATKQTAAYCLYRFGVLLAANDLAHRYWPDLPMADSSEQGIAQRLAATVKSSG